MVLLFLALPPWGFALYAGGKSQRGPAGSALPQQQEQLWELEPPALSYHAADAGTPPPMLENPDASSQDPPPPGENPFDSALAGGAPPPQRPGRGELVMKALAQGYPERVGPAEFRDGDWAVPLEGTWFYYAEGRLLPRELLPRAAEYDPQPFYNYPAELPPWEPPAAGEVERIRGQVRRRLQNPPKRSQHFYDTLWRAASRAESWDRVKSLRFLGRPVYVHYSILEELALVEERILAESRTDPQVKRWIDSLNVLDGWNWRNIADTQSRSFHAYGAALDLLPRSRGNLETYWSWTSRNRSDWWAVPYSQRLHPPDPVIRAFEAYGFVWGGKWMYYDTMHFEYRPEIFILNKLPLSSRR
ncbi:MAG: M15 family metallopeptidase [Treponema sp.]|nr:M15 family metallopeptidase [Treponema sp.]